MKNVSIRTKILTGVVIVNLLGALVLVVYLHQSYARSLDAAAAEVSRETQAAWLQLSKMGAIEALDPIGDPQSAVALLTAMNEITGTDYGLLVDKASTDAEAYASSREQLALASNWDEGATYAMLATTNDAAASRMAFDVSPETVPVSGKLIGIENGACSKTCHNTIQGEGAYWGVKWSEDESTLTHGVVPIASASGEPIGVIYALDDVSGQADAARESMWQTMIVIGVTLLISTLLIAGMIDRLVFKRLARTVLSIEDMSIRVAGGDFDARFEPDGSHDEIGEFEAFFSQFMELMSATLKSLVKRPDDSSTD